MDSGLDLMILKSTLWTAAPAPIINMFFLVIWISFSTRSLIKPSPSVERACNLSLDLNITTVDIKGENKYAAATSKVGDFISDYILNQEDSNLNFKNIHMGQSTII